MFKKKGILKKILHQLGKKRGGGGDRQGEGPHSVLYGRRRGGEVREKKKGGEEIHFVHMAGSMQRGGGEKKKRGAEGKKEAPPPNICYLSVGKKRKGGRSKEASVIS